MVLDIETFARDVLKTPTDRDKQRLVGPSNLSNQCTRCLADDMLRSEQAESRFWMGAVIGTAIHELFSVRVQDNPDVLTEHKLVLGDIPNYGTVKGTMDLYVKPAKTVVDLKTTNRKKLATYKRVLRDSDQSASLVSARLKINNYINQTMLYGKAATASGLPVKKVAIAFICRDGTGDNDIWVWETAFDPDRAEKVWQRAKSLWAWLQDGNNPDTLPSAEGCYYCETTRGV